MADKIFSIDVRLVATCYVRAADAEAAMAEVKRLCNTGLNFPDDSLEHMETPISGRQYDDPELPAVSLSPAMTLVGPDEGDEVELVSDLEESETSDA